MRGGRCGRRRRGGASVCRRCIAAQTLTANDEASREGVVLALIIIDLHGLFCFLLRIAGRRRTTLAGWHRRSGGILRICSRRDKAVLPDKTVRRESSNSRVASAGIERTCAAEGWPGRDGWLRTVRVWKLVLAWRGIGRPGGAGSWVSGLE